MKTDFCPGGGTFVYENAEDGVWRYADDELKVELIRYQSVRPDPMMIWYEAEVWTRGSEYFRTFTAEEDKYVSAIDTQVNIARKHGVVFSINTDYAQHRYPWNKQVGVFIRNGRIIKEKTVPAEYKRFPTLDMLAIWPDGRMEIYESDEYSGQELLDMGVTDVMCFGPILLRDGVIYEEEIKKRFNNDKAPRTGIGYIEPGHYVATMVEGRCKGSDGCYVLTLAHILKNKGCVGGLNLDGGKTSCITFMGQRLNKINPRKAAEILGVGTCEQAMDAE